MHDIIFSGKRQLTLGIDDPTGNSSVTNKPLRLVYGSSESHSVSHFRFDF